MQIFLVLAFVVFGRSSAFFGGKTRLDELFEEVLEETIDTSLERPDVFSMRGKREACHENGVVASWCDKFQNPSLGCAILPDFDEYGCSCLGDAAVCPDDCVGGTEPAVKTHYGIRCGGIPVDEPNYILRESHPLNRCENNGIVSSWCDDFVNPHLECHISPLVDEYSCKCGKASNCPTDCVGGMEPIEKTHRLVRCKLIPVDQPNYILKEE